MAEPAVLFGWTHHHPTNVNAKPPTTTAQQIIVTEERGDKARCEEEKDVQAEV